MVSMHSEKLIELDLYTCTVLFERVSMHSEKLIELDLYQELCESRGGRPGLPVPNSPYGLCGLGLKATLNLNSDTQSSRAV